MSAVAWEAVGGFVIVAVLYVIARVAHWARTRKEGSS